MEQPIVAPAAGTRAWSPRLSIALLMGYFVLFGITVGGQGVLWADIKAALALSDGVFGTSQLASPVMGVATLLFGAPVVALLGKKRLALLGLLALGLSSLAIAAAGGLWALVGALLVAGLGFGAVELAMNSATMDWEHATRRSVMNVMHAGFSGGAVLGALGAGALLQWGWAFPAVLAAIAACAGVALVLTLPVRYPPADPRPDGGSGPLSALRLLLGSGALRLLALLSLLGVVGESVANTWSVIYLRSLGAEAFVGGAAFALFNATMFVGRLVNQPLVARLGARASLLISGALLLASGALLLVPGQIGLAVAGFGLAGVGVAGVIPTALSAAALLAPGRSSAVTGAIMAVTYLGFVVCAPLIGWLAELFSLQLALASVGVSGVLILLLGRAVPR